MSRSELRRQRREKLAAQRASTIVAEAKERVLATKPSQPSPPQDQATEVKRLRDQGESWWIIGQRLGLAGPASSASEAEAKRGAGAARRLYAAANRGIVPRTHAPRKGTTPKVQTVGNAGTITARKTQLVEHGHVIPRDMTDDEVEAMLLGRTIVWAIDLARLTDTDPDSWGSADKRWVEQEARVHVLPTWVKVVDRSDEGKDRVVFFREYGGRDKEGRHLSGPTRCVRVDSIFTVR